MTNLQKAGRVLSGLLVILLGILIILIPATGFGIAVLLIGCGFEILGLRLLIYYVTMGRHMVGGKIILFFGMIAFDAGILTLSFRNVPHMYLIVYLLSTYAFSGLVDVLRAREAKQLEASSWRYDMIRGTINILLALAALVYGFIFKHEMILAYIYSAGLIYTGLSRIQSIFRKTSIVYIQ